MQVQGGLGRHAAAGAAFLGGAQIFRVALTTLSTVVVARLLTPGDYGVVAMVSPITGILLVFQNLGLNQAMVQAERLNDEQLNALFWINLAASAVIALIILLAAPLISIFYHEPRAGYLAAATSATIFLSGATLQHTALLNRSLRFATLARIDITNSVSTFVATFILALLLRDYWALWAGAAVGLIASVIQLWTAEAWRPNFRIRLKEAHSLVGFGAHVTGFNFANFLARNLDNVLIAKFCGAAQLGLYDRSYKLMMFPIQNINNPLGRVMVPILSRVQSDPERYRRSFLLAVRLILLVATPLIVTAAALSDRLVPFLLGHRWAGASPIFFWLSIAALFQPLTNATGWLFISSGRGKALMQWGVFSSAITIIGFIVGLRWGAVGVAASYALTGALIRTPAFCYWAVKQTPITLHDFIGLLAGPVAAGALAWLAIELLTVTSPAAIALTCGLTIAYASSFLAYTMTAGGREALARMWQIGLQSLRSARPDSVTT